MALIKAFVVNMAISAVWYATEYIQFGELQWDRQCDNVVWYIYLGVMWYLFREREKAKRTEHGFDCPLICPNCGATLNNESDT